MKEMNLRERGIPLKKKWRACVGAGSAQKGLRADWQRQFGVAVAQCGFERARLSGWNKLNRRDAKETDALCDFLTDLSISPIVRLDAKDAAEDLESFARHAIARYGAKRIHNWRFEIPLNDNFAKRADALKSADAYICVSAVTTLSRLAKDGVPRRADSVVLQGPPDDKALAKISCVLESLDDNISTHWDGVSASHRMEDGVRDAVRMTRRHLSAGFPLDSLSLVSFSGICGEGAYLVDDCGVRQPSGHAYRMMETLGDEEIGRGKGYIVTRGKNGCIRALAWTDPLSPNELSIAGLTPGSKLMIETLDADHGWAYPTWRQMGSPGSLTRYQAQALKQAALRTDVKWVKADDEGKLRWKLPTGEDAIVLLRE